MTKRTCPCSSRPSATNFQSDWGLTRIAQGPVDAKADCSGSAGITDHVEAASDSGRGEPLASLSRLGLSKIPLEGRLVDKHDWLLKGGFCADVEQKSDRSDTSGTLSKTKELELFRTSTDDLLGRNFRRDSRHSVTYSLTRSDREPRGSLCFVSSRWLKRTTGSSNAVPRRLARCPCTKNCSVGPRSVV